MIGSDYQYVRKTLERGYLSGPCLEIGVGLEGVSNRDQIRDHDLVYYGSDMVAGPDVDFIVDFDDPIDVIKHQLVPAAPFGSILALNVLEHTFNPIEVLDKLFALLTAGGTCVIIAPAVWPLHDFPIDCWRTLPTFYSEYARRRNLTLLQDTFEYVGYGPITQFSKPNGTFVFPRPGKSALHRRYSRVVHRFFNTFGRGMFFPPHIAVGVVIRNSPLDLGNRDM